MNYFSYMIHIFSLILLKTYLFGDFYIPDRSAYPALCETHFDNNKATAHTWLEAEDKSNLIPFRFFLDLIPTPYEADCYGCSECGGVRLNLYDDHFEWPTEDAFEEITKSHKYTRQPTYDKYGYNCIPEGPDHCETSCWDGGYFRKWNHQYIHFFHHYLQYCSENRCSCFWPETSLSAVRINDCVYALLRDFADEELIDVDFSEYWIAYRRKFDFSQKNIQRIDGEEYYPNSHGIASSLVTYTFFYSQYHQMLLSVASYIDTNSIYNYRNAIDRTYQTLESIRKDFSILYDKCLIKHPHPKIFYERGLLKMHSGDNEGAISDISYMMNLAKTDLFKDKITITSEMYHQEGKAYADTGLYDKAIESLTEAIKLDPTNSSIYFDRACAYFETGNFDEALSDYLLNRSDLVNSIRSKSTLEFEEGFLKGLLEGGKDAVIDFVPSICHSVYGMGEALWICSSHPVEFAAFLASPSREIVKIAYENFKDLDAEQAEEYCDELKEFYNKFNQLEESEKGQKTGYVIGKYGVDLFSGGACLKAITAFNKLKRCNQICNIESMAISTANETNLISQALKHVAARENYFKNVKYHWGAHYKHVPDHSHYVPRRSIFEHKDPEGLLRRYAGTGMTCRGSPGVPGYKEVVDFNEHIGIFINKEGTIHLPTTRGTIHYGKNGAHIVPASPKSLIGSQ